MLARRTFFTAAAAALLCAALPAAAAEISGAGATFPYPIYAKWAEAYKAKTGIGMNYQSIGSGGGIKQIKAKTVDFGASDMPLKPEELEKNGLAQFPMVMGGVVPVVNLRGGQAGRAEARRHDARRHLSRQDHQMERSGDRRAQSGRQAARQGDRRRSTAPTGPGTNFIFTDYLSKVSPEWKAKVGENTSVEWPAGLGGKGNEGVAALASPHRGRHRLCRIRLCAAEQDDLHAS